MKEIENGKWLLYNEEDIEEYIKMLYAYTHKGESDFSDCIVFNVFDTNPYMKNYCLTGIDEMAQELSNRLDDEKEITVSEPLSFSGKNEKSGTSWNVTVDGKKTMENLLAKIGLPFPLLKHILES